MNGDDHDEGPPKGMTPPPELDEARTLGCIETLRRKRVCLYPGPQRPPYDAGITDFSHCLRYLGDSNALIFCAPNRGKEAVREDIEHYAGGGNRGLVFNRDECVGLPPGDILIWEDDLLFPTKKENLLVWHFKPDAEPQATRPPDDRFWAHYVILKIEGRAQKLHLLHLGLRGDHAWLYFLQPHGIPVARLISSPFYQ
ncbi:MAG: hypothetical protein ABSF95_00565 [Verrucomicrobiota bacterium]|jgi:hypothetical protein